MSKKKGVVGVVIGAMVGFLAGILSAPRSGKETREKVKETASGVLAEAETKIKELYNFTSHQIKELSDKYEDAKGDAAKELTKLTKRAEKIKAQAKLLLSEMHDGLFDEGQLDKLVNEGKQIKEEVKKFISKYK